MRASSAYAMTAADLTRVMSAAIRSSRPLKPVADIMARVDLILVRMPNDKARVAMIDANIEAQEDLLRAPIDQLPKEGYDPVHAQDILHAYRQRREALTEGRRLEFIQGEIVQVLEQYRSDMEHPDLDDAQRARRIERIDDVLAALRRLA